MYSLRTCHQGLLAVAFLWVGGQAFSVPPDVDSVLAGIDQRIDAVFRSEAGRPLEREEIGEPLAEGRGRFGRRYSFSIVRFAARCLYLGEQLDGANAALAENARFYLANPEAIPDRDSFHWHADVILRLIEMYGSNGTAQAGRITPETEALLLEPIWVYASTSSWLDKAEFEQSKTWHLYSSENHHTMDFVIHWHFSKLAKDLEGYKDLKYEDGAGPAEHYEAWNAYVVEYCKERARRGICVEMMNGGYNATMMKPLYNCYDFGDDRVRRAAGMLLDLYYAYWAEEQIDGVMGGGKSRVYFGEALTHRGHGIEQEGWGYGIDPIAWLYFGIGHQPELHGHDINPMLSSYRPPAIVAEIALDVEGRGRYEVRQRAQGLGKQGHTFPHMNRPDKSPNKLRTDGGGILRYSYCDPAFIIGCPMIKARPLADWVFISAQNRWQGVVFAGDDDARIVPVVRPRDNWRAMNAQWSVQSRGTLISQKLKTHQGAAEMLVWFSREGLSPPEEDDGIVFVEAPGAYAAIRVPTGGYQWREGAFTAHAETGTRTTRPGLMLVPENEYAPVIVEVMAKGDIDGFEAFKVKVKSCIARMDDSVLSYSTIYGDQISMDTDQQQTPVINGTPVDYAPPKLYDSPFLNADYGTGIVTISKGDRVLVLDFTRL